MAPDFRVILRGPNKIGDETVLETSELLCQNRRCSQISHKINDNIMALGILLCVTIPALDCRSACPQTCIRYCKCLNESVEQAFI